MAAQTVDGRLAERMRALRHDPIGWVERCYSWRETGKLERHQGLEQWQADVLGEIEDGLKAGRSPIKVAVASGHGIGKTGLMSMVRGWSMSTCVDTRGIVTAGTFTQLQTKTLPEMATWASLQINRHWFDGNIAYRYALDPARRETWRFDAIAWNESNPEAFAGLHNQGRRIVVLYDEASQIPEIIWETTEGALTDQNTEIIWLAFGNPTRATGRFKECWGRFRSSWKTWNVDSRTVSFTNKEQIASWEAAYGEDSDFMRVRVKGQFPRTASTQFISSDLVEQAAAREGQCTPYDPFVYGVDVAREGDDQSVIYRRRGRDGKTWPPIKLREPDTMRLAAYIADMAQREAPDAIFVDEGGVGGGVVDRLRQLNVRGVQGVKFGGAPDRTALNMVGQPGEKYANKRAEIWGAMRAWLRDGAIPVDQELHDDLTGVEFGHNQRDEIQLERKQDMKKRGLASPDVADALALTFSYPVIARADPTNSLNMARTTDYHPHDAL